MICVLPFYKGDRDLAQKLLDWIIELGDMPQILFIRDSRAASLEIKLTDAEQLIMTGLGEIVVTDDAWDKWPESCNWMVSKAGRFIDQSPWLWLEADSVPMRAGWWQALKDEWAKAQAADKWFVGDLVDAVNVPLHMSGVAIYPPNVISHAGEMLISREIAWDVQAAWQILPKFYQTKLIRHAWKHPAINNMGELDNLRAQMPECVLFHADKAHSIIPLLRMERENDNRLSDAQTGATTATKEIIFPAPVLAEPQAIPHERQARESTSDTPESRTQQDSRGGENTLPCLGDMQRRGAGGLQHGPLLCDIFIKTYPPDYEWLEYCLQSVNRFCTGFRKIVVISDEALQPSGGASPILNTEAPLFVKIVGTQPDGYLWQQVIKLDADKYTDAPFICYIDSDTIFTRPVTPATFFEEQAGCQSPKIKWMMTPYEKVHTPWQPVVEKFLKKPVAFEFMRRHPFVLPRWLLAELRGYCEREHGMALDSYIMSQPHREFSEFNVVGAFAYEFFRDEFIWINTEEQEEWPPLTVLQSWSRGGLTPEIRQVYEAILSGPDDGPSGRVEAADDGPMTGTTQDKAGPVDCSSGPADSPDTYHPKASLDTYPSEGAAKQSGTAPSTLREVGIGENDSPTTANGDRTSPVGTDFESLVVDTVAVLKRLCSSPWRTHRVRYELKKQKVIGPARTTRRKK